MLAASEHPRFAQARKKLTRVPDDRLRIRRNCPRTHHRPRSFKRQINRRREIYIEAKRPATLPDNPAMFPEELSVSSSESIGRRWRRAQHLAEAIDPSTLQIDAAEQWRAHGGLAIFQKLVRLPRARDIAREENDAGGLNSFQQAPQPRRHFRAIKANDQKLADIRGE
jgi:hypothetical protein